MYYCKRCGNRLDFKIGTCRKCGLNYDFRTEREVKAEGKGFAFGWAILGFFMPFIGLVLFLYWRKTYKVRSKSVGIGALTGEILSIIAAVVLSVSLVSSIVFGFVNPLTAAYNDGKNNSEITAPLPENAKYENSADGTLKFNVVESPTAYAAAFDEKTQTVLGRDYHTVYFYDAWGGAPYYNKLLRSQNSGKNNYMTFNYSIRCLDAHNGIVAIGFGEIRKMALIDVEYGGTTYIDADVAVNYVKITDDYVVYSNVGKNGYCEVRAMKLSGNEDKLIGVYYSPSFAVVAGINRVFICENEGENKRLEFVDLDTFGRKTVDNLHSSEGKVFYDGEYIHALGNLYGAGNGKLIASGQTPVFEENIRLYSQLCCDGEYRVVSTSNCQTALFYAKTNQLVRVYDLYATEAYSLGGGRFVALCGESGYFADFSVTLFSVPDAYGENFKKRETQNGQKDDYDPSSFDEEANTAEKIESGIFEVGEGYKKITYDFFSGRIYALYDKEIASYEVDTGEKVLSLTLENESSDFCFGENFIAVGYSDNGHIDLFNNQTLEKTSIDTGRKNVREMLYIQNTVVFTEKNEGNKNSKAYFLDPITGEITETQESFFFPVMIEEREGNVVLIAETGTYMAAYFIDFADERKVTNVLRYFLEKCDEGRDAVDPYFDGEYFHIYGKLVRLNGGTIAAEKEYIDYRVTQNLIRQLYFDDSIVISVNDKDRIVVIDTQAVEVKKVINFFATSIFKIPASNIFIVIDEYSGRFATIAV